MIGKLVSEIFMFESVDGRTDGCTDVRPILNIRPVYKGPLIRGQVSEITGQFSSELARSYQTDKLLRAISSLDVHHHRHKMALFKKFILLPPLRSPESFEATYRGPWPLVEIWPLVYLQTTKKAPKSISVARTDARTDAGSSPIL